MSKENKKLGLIDIYDIVILRHELDRTRKALDVAVDALKLIDKQLMTGIEMTSQARNALEQITATLENQNGNC